VHVLVAPAPGPTALIQGGIHGDEIAGVHALEEMLEDGALRPERGRLLVVPAMNRAAYRARERAAPGGLDLNRCFPGDAGAPEPERRLARRFMELVLDETPALVATLHESQKRYHPDVKPSFGQTLVYGVQPIPPLIARAVERLDAARESDEEAWAAQHYPVATSSTEVIVDAIGCVGVCVETWMGFPERRRIEMQKEVVRVLLDELGVLSFSCPSEARA
jgi:predicted deacylase